MSSMRRRGRGRSLIEGRSPSMAGTPWATRRAISRVSDHTAEAVGSWPAPRP